MTGPLPITPDTKIAQLLEAYPELEPVLIAAAPAFSKPELLPARAADRAAGAERIQDGGGPLGRRLCDLHRPASRRANLMEKAIYMVG